MYQTPQNSKPEIDSQQEQLEYYNNLKQGKTPQTYSLLPQNV